MGRMLSSGHHPMLRVAAALGNDVAKTIALEPRAMSSPSALNWVG